MSGSTHYTLKQVRQSREYAVSGAPDTRGTGRRAATVRPETLTIKFADGDLVWAAVRGRRIIRRDGSSNTYGEIGFGAYRFGVDPLPSWIADILRDEGWTWPEATEGGAR